MAYPNDQQNPAGAIPVWITSGGGGGGPTGPAVIGVSANGTVGATSATLIAAGQYSGWVTIQNTGTGTLYISFNATATTAGIAILAGAAMTLPFGPTNALTGIGSAAGVTWAAIGY